MSEQGSQTVDEGKALATSHPKTHAETDGEQAVRMGLKIGRAYHFALMAVFFAALAVGGGFYLWMEMNQLQKYAYAEGGIQDVGGMRDDIRQSQTQLSGLRMRLDELVNIDSQIARVTNEVAALKGNFTELRQGTHEQVQQAQTAAQTLIGEKLGALESQLTQAHEKLAQTQGAVGEMRDQVTSKLAVLEKDQIQFQNRIQESVATVEKELMRSQTQRVLAEVEHYLKVAQQRVQVEKEVRAAENALQVALTRLNELSDSEYGKLRQTISDNLAALRAVKQADISGIAKRIGELQAGIDSLPIKGMEKRFALAGGEEEQAKGSVWDKTLASLRRGLHKVVHIRRQDEPVMPLLAPEHSFFLYQNIRLKLEVARLALLKRDQPVYRDSLRNAHQWARKYLAATAASEQVINSLQSLAGLDIDPALPDLGNALQLLRDDRQTTVSAQQAAKP